MMTREHEKELIIAAQNGDNKASTTLWIYWRVMMMRIFSCLHGMTQEEIDSEAAEVFCIVLHDFDVLKVPSDKCSLGWILSMRSKDRVHRIIQKRRRQWQVRQYEVDDIVERNEYEHRVSMARMLLEIDEVRDAILVEQFIATLTRKQQRIIALMRQGLSRVELSSALGVDVSTVDYHRRMILQAFRQFAKERCIT